LDEPGSGRASGLPPQAIAVVNAVARAAGAIAVAHASALGWNTAARWQFWNASLTA